MHHEMDNVDGFLGNKRFRVTTGEDSEDPEGEETPEMNPVVQPRASRSSLPQPSSPSFILNLDSEKREHMDDRTSSELELFLTKDEVRHFLREEGWQVTMIMRKSSPPRERWSPFWYYKAPADGNCKQITFPSLFGAINEYNRRVHFQNIMNMEQKPTVHLKKGADCSEGFMRTTITDKKEKIPPRRSLLPRPSNGPFCSAADHEGAEGIIEDTCTVTVPSEQFTAEAASGHAPIPTVRTFGAFTQNLVEKEGEYVLEIDVLNFGKDELRVHIEENKLIVSATYSSESASSKVSTTTEGDLTSRLSLPDSAIPNLVTATLELGILRLTIPKCRS